MTIKYYDSPFHVARDEKLANKVAMKIDLSIMLSKLIKDRGWTQAQAAEMLNVNQSRISDLKNAKIEKFTIDSMLNMLELLGYKTHFTMSSLENVTISIAKPDA